MNCQKCLSSIQSSAGTQWELVGVTTTLILILASDPPSSLGLNRLPRDEDIVACKINMFNAFPGLGSQGKRAACFLQNRIGIRCLWVDKGLFPGEITDTTKIRTNIIPNREYLSRTTSTAIDVTARFEQDSLAITPRGKTNNYIVLARMISSRNISPVPTSARTDSPVSYNSEKLLMSGARELEPERVEYPWGGSSGKGKEFGPASNRSKFTQ
ncbi:hypothetical protein J6590_074495 [Homalodisca vitripennis]|nr:hypothetical protein J6590_074495 [Homalodisca vitripennis]